MDDVVALDYAVIGRLVAYARARGEDPSWCLAQLLEAAQDLTAVPPSEPQPEPAP